MFEKDYNKLVKYSKSLCRVFRTSLEPEEAIANAYIEMIDKKLDYSQDQFKKIIYKNIANTLLTNMDYQLKRGAKTNPYVNDQDSHNQCKKCFKILHKSFFPTYMKVIDLRDVYFKRNMCLICVYKKSAEYKRKQRSFLSDYAAKEQVRTRFPDLVNNKDFLIFFKSYLTKLRDNKKWYEDQLAAMGINNLKNGNKTRKG